MKRDVGKLGYRGFVGIANLQGSFFAYRPFLHGLDTGTILLVSRSPTLELHLQMVEHFDLKA